MDNKILYAAKFTHHDLKFHKVWWKSDKRFGSWSGQTDRWTDRQGRPVHRHKKWAVKIQHCPISSKFDMLVDNDVPN
jgi:hypothetical protein